jgi:hypothetical protein
MPAKGLGRVKTADGGLPRHDFGELDAFGHFVEFGGFSILNGADGLPERAERFASWTKA